MRRLSYSSGTTSKNLPDYSTENRSQRSSHDVFGELINHIKKVLNLDMKSNAMDEHFVNSFNIYNPDPMYVFVLPGDESNITLVFHRSNFSETSFPNTTSLLKLHSILKNSKLGQYIQFERHRAPKLLVNDFRFFERYKELMNDADLDDAASLRVVEENVRTERNFFKFMDNLNKQSDVQHNDVTTQSYVNSDTFGLRLSHSSKQNGQQYKENQLKQKGRSEYQSLLKNIHSHSHLGNYQLGNSAQHYENFEKEKFSTNSQGVTWEDLGLPG